MQFNDFFELCSQIFAANEGLPTLGEKEAEKLFLLTERMLKVNESMNLTAIKQEHAIILRHYADSLTVSKHLDEGARIIDVGCGAGFPTLPLAIFRPDLEITALDSTAKRTEYVRSTAELLGLANVNTVAARAEELANLKEYRESFDYATARAVAALPILTELCLPFVRVGGRFVAMKAQRAAEELSLSSGAIQKCGGRLENAIPEPLFDTDGTSESRTIIIIHKTSPTPKEFPRHFSKISKKPL